MDVSTGSNLPVPPLGSQNENGGIILLPDDHGRERDSDCWRPKETTTVDGTDQEVKLGAGEAIEQVYEVWSHPNEDTCFAIGDYEFSVDYTTSNGSEQSLVWEFTLSVESVS